MTTYEFNNHAVRSEAYRYIRYANGDEEFYDETKDPYEWTNLASDPSIASEKAALAKYLPAKNAPDVSQSAGKNPQKAAKKAAQREHRAEARKASWTSSRTSPPIL